MEPFFAILNPRCLLGVRKYAKITLFLVEAVTALKSITLVYRVVCILQNIWTNQDFRDLQQQASEMFPGLQIGTGLFVPSRPKARVHPLIRLLNYRDKYDLKLIDFFKRFDKNGDMTLSHDEFLEGMRVRRKKKLICDVAAL